MTDPPTRVYPFVADGGIRAPATGCPDPYATLDDLMAVVETLCPVWPDRPDFREMLNARL